MNPTVGDIVFSATSAGLEMRARVSRVDQDEYWVELELQGSPEAAAWTPPKATDNFETFAFGAWLDGSGLPVWFGDMDGDGKPELLAPIPKGDLSPTVYRIFRWTGEELLFLRKRALLWVRETEFEWAHLPDPDQDVAWIEGIDGTRADVFELRGSQANRATVEIEPWADGFRVIKNDS